MTKFTGKTFGPSDIVQAQDNSFYNCIFDDCEIVGERGAGEIIGCEFKGRAGEWFKRFIAPHTFMTVDLETGGVEFGAAGSTKH